MDSNYLEKIKFKKINFLSVIFFIILLMEIFFLVEKVNISTIVYNNELIKSNRVIGELHKNESIRQNFVSKSKNLSSIGLIFGTYNRINTDIILFELYDQDTKKIVRKIKINSSTLRDNEEYKILFTPLKNSENKNYSFKLTSLSGEPNNSLTVYVNNSKINEIEDILFNLGYSNHLYKMIFIFIITAIVIIYITISFSIKRIQKKENIFLLLALTYGLITLFLFPPFQVPDEKMHFYRAYAISKGKIIPKKFESNVNANGNSIPNSVHKLNKVVKSDSIKFNYNEKLNLYDFKNALSIPLKKNELIKTNFQGAAIINPISYIPQSIGIYIGNFISLPIIFVFYLARLSNFMVWVLVIFVAIKQVPKIKSIFLILALLPLSIQQGVSCSPDALINAFSFLFLSYVLKLYVLENETFNWKYAVCFFLGIFIPTSIKVVYLLFIILLIGLPIKKFKTSRKAIIYITSVFLITLLINMVWSKLSPDNPVSPVGQINYLKSNLPVYITTIYLTTREMFQFYIESSIGVLGWLDTRVPYMLIYTYIVILLIHTFLSKIIIKDKKMLYSIILYLLGTYTGILTALYIAWTKPGGEIVDGVQGRYFFPLLPVVFVLISRMNFKLKGNIKSIDLNTHLFLNFSLVCLLISLISRYYI